MEVLSRGQDEPATRRNSTGSRSAGLFCSGDENAIQFAITASSVMQQNETVFSHCVAEAAGTSSGSGGTEVNQLVMRNADCEMKLSAKPDGFAVMVE